MDVTSGAYGVIPNETNATSALSVSVELTAVVDSL
jgi:hypothetical protein